MFKKILGLILGLSSLAAVSQSLPVNNDKIFRFNSGPENYVKNPSCWKGVADITASGGSLTKNTSSAVTRLGTDCLVDASANAQTYDWLTETKPTSLSGACLASFFYLGDASLYTAEVYDGSNTISDVLTLGNYASGQPVEIGYSCVSGARVRIKSTSSSAAAIQVGGVSIGKDIRVGISNEKELVVYANFTGTQAISSTAETKINFDNEVTDVYGEFSSGTFTAKRAGTYIFSGNAVATGYTLDEPYSADLFVNGTTAACNAEGHSSNAATAVANAAIVSCPIVLAVGDTVEMRSDSNADASYSVGIHSSSVDGDTWISIQRVPSGSDLTLRGNVNNLSGTLKYPATASCTWAASGATFASAGTDADCSGTPTETGNLTYIGSKLPGFKARNILPGTYLMFGYGQFQAPASTSGSQDCHFAFNDGTTTSGDNEVSQAVTTYRGNTAVIAGTFTYTAAQTNVSYEVFIKRSIGNNTCQIIGDSSDLSFALIPLDSTISKPFIPGSTFFGRSAVTKMCVAEVALSGSSSETNDPDGCISSVGNYSSGISTINFTTGFFSSAPYCFVSRCEATNTMTEMKAYSPSTTSVTVRCREASAAGSATTVQACTSNQACLLCMGNN